MLVASVELWPGGSAWMRRCIASMWKSRVFPTLPRCRTNSLRLWKNEIRLRALRRAPRSASSRSTHASKALGSCCSGHAPRYLRLILPRCRPKCLGPVDHHLKDSNYAALLCHWRKTHGT